MNVKKDFSSPRPIYEAEKSTNEQKENNKKQKEGKLSKFCFNLYQVMTISDEGRLD